MFAFHSQFANFTNCHIFCHKSRLCVANTEWRKLLQCLVQIMIYRTKRKFYICCYNSLQMLISYLCITTRKQCLCKAFDFVCLDCKTSSHFMSTYLHQML